MQDEEGVLLQLLTGSQAVRRMARRWGCSEEVKQRLLVDRMRYFENVAKLNPDADCRLL